MGPRNLSSWGALSARSVELPGDPRPVRLGQYRIVRELGRGGMACVYEGRHVELGNRAAIKVLNPTLASETSVARFAREARAASQIRHQNVVQVYDVGVDHGRPFLVMEFLDGVNLAALLAERGPLPPSGLVELFLPILSAVQAAHDAGVIHRDLKPANVMVVRRAPHGPQPVVLDFGISKLSIGDDVAAPLTRSEALLGTVHYMAPELTKGADQATPLSDQYALGVMLYECATGRRPFTGSSYYDILQAILTEPVLAPGDVVDGFPSELGDVILRAMHRDPSKRYPSVQALGSALLGFGGKRAWAIWEPEFVAESRSVAELWDAVPSTIADAPRGAPLEPAEPPRRGRAARLLAIGKLAAALALVVAVVAAALDHPRAERPETGHVAVRGATAAREPTSPDTPRTNELAPASLAAPTAPQSAVTTPVTPTPSASPRPAAAPEHRRSATRPNRAVPARAHRISRGENQPQVATGTNGALILE